jgi:hypothetical protein
MVTKVYPRFCKRPMIVESAVTVCERSPPPSCIRMIEPLCVFVRILLTMALTPGRAQSLGSTFHKIVESLSECAMSSTWRLKAS